MADHKFFHQPVFHETTVSYSPPAGDPMSRPTVIYAPCICGDPHEWLVEIPPNTWRLVTKLGEGGLADLQQLTKNPCAAKTAG
jgi:hypothetical protein